MVLTFTWPGLNSQLVKERPQWVEDKLAYSESLPSYQRLIKLWTANHKRRAKIPKQSICKSTALLTIVFVNMNRTYVFLAAAHPPVIEQPALRAGPAATH